LSRGGVALPLLLHRRYPTRAVPAGARGFPACRYRAAMIMSQAGNNWRWWGADVSY